jgi:Pregnancy-associated plasma protein-A
MKFTKYLISTGLLLLLGFGAFSQPICGFDIVHKREMQVDPVYRQNVLTNEASIRSLIQKNALPKQSSRSPITLDQTTPSTLSQINPAPTTLSGPPYTIPVVVHVIHTGGVIGTIYNPTDAQIIGAIAYLNAVYNGTEPGTVGAGDLQIQFVLAQRDPNCNPTNGINRVDGSGVAGYVSGGVQGSQTVVGTPDINIKNLSRWDPTQYYNIWIVDKIDGADGTGSGSFIAGFAFFPGSPALEDGIVMLATQMIDGQKTLPHEMGHAFNLYHPFQSTDPNNATCAANTSCSTQGDMICDTDPITIPINFACRTGANNPCTGTPYTISTENNYMNYTFCYSLFTTDQKTRMLASAAISPRASLTTSLGGTAPGAGGSPCVPKIDFELLGDQQTETTTTTSGCRAYTDHSYNMVIGNTPSAAATATISQSSGTATRGLDYDLTTNGNFTTPSSVINFPAGATTPQPFTIRVYDDAGVNGTRTAVLGFTVNNGGGNAVAGDGRSGFTLIMNDNDFAPTAGTPAGTVNIGTSAGLIGVAPFDARQTAERTQFLYMASELTAAGVPAGALSGISMNLQKLSTRPYTNFKINIGTASVPYLVNGGLSEGSNMTTVKTLASYNTVGGWNNFLFDTPFTWDGASNIVVEISYNDGTTAAGEAADNIAVYLDGGSASQGNLIWQTGIDCTTPFTSVNAFGNGTKPIIQLTYGISPTVVQTVLNSSQQQYLGPNADLYFYDQTNSRLMARIQNLSAFDYGCTQILIDRQGSSATQFWNSNTSNYLMDKTFHVLPTTNNPAGSYNITLYYTQAEINGWTGATSQSLSNIQLVKVSGQISGVTPAAPAGGGTMVTGAPTISVLGTNTGFTYNFTNGFSGFGAGIPGSSPLPISLLNFQGHLQDHTVALNWATSQEQNSKDFGIERSYDGKAFVNIGNVPAAGNSVATRLYSFTDPSIARDENYYRLRQIDLDDHFIYSPIVVIADHLGIPAGAFTVLSNPFTDNLDIQFGSIALGQVKARLLDITGKELLSQSDRQSGSGRMRIDLSDRHISAGIYLLELGFNGGTYIQKVIKR